MDLPNLPDLAIRELFGMLPIQSKRRLRLISHSFRDMIDIMSGVKFFVTLSDDTLEHVLKFSRFDLELSPRNLYRLEVTNLLTPFTLKSTSLSRCPLPHPIDTLAFTQTLGVSERNFFTLIRFYLTTYFLRRLEVNLDCIESKVSNIKSIRELEMNSIQHLELNISSMKDKMSLNKNGNEYLDLAAAFLQGTYRNLKVFKADFDDGPISQIPSALYRDINNFISRHLKNLTDLKVIHPCNYERTERTLYPTGLLRVQVLNEFEHSSSSLRELRLWVPCNEMSLGDGVWLGHDYLGLQLVNHQQHLTVLQLTGFSFTSLTTLDLDLPNVLRNCGNTLVTLDLCGWIVRMAARFLFNLGWLEPCRVLKRFELRCDWKSEEDYDYIGFENTEALPASLEHLLLPQIVAVEDLMLIRRKLTKLQSFEFWNSNASPEQVDILLGDEGIPSLKRVTLYQSYHGIGLIRSWASELHEDSMVTISETLHKLNICNKYYRVVVLEKNAVEV